MKFSKTYKRIFGVGPVGLITTFLVWALFFYTEKWIGLPPMKISGIFRIFLLVVLGLDAVYLYVGGMIVLMKNQWGNKLVTQGPYQFIRHPFYSALIYSATGSLALWLYSWALLISVIPLTLFWSWLATKEERYIIDRFGDEYLQYMKKTGQFFPSYSYFKSEMK